MSAYNSKTSSVTPIFLLSNCNQHNKMQLFAKFKKILRRGFRATLNFQKIKVALSPLCRIFLNFAKSCILLCWLPFDNKIWGSPSSFLRYLFFKSKIKGVFSKSYCCYGNLSCDENNTNVFTSDWAVFWYYDCSINW